MTETMVFLPLVLLLREIG